jgi:hypothetical protein
MTFEFGKKLGALTLLGSLSLSSMGFAEKAQNSQTDAVKFEIKNSERVYTMEELRELDEKGCRLSDIVSQENFDSRADLICKPGGGLAGSGG